MNKKHIGSSLRSLFVELGEEEELDLLTRKKVLADQLAASMKRLKLSKAALALAMKTSRSAVYRLLDPNDTGVTMETLSKASQALDLDLKISFAPRARSKAPAEPLVQAGCERASAEAPHGTSRRAGTGRGRSS